MSKQAIAAFTADNHLRPWTWVKYPTLTGDAYYSWRQIVDYCVARGLPLWLLGDLFDSTRPDPLSVSVYLQSMAQMDAASLPVLYIEGNHERTDYPWASLATTVRQATAFNIGELLVTGVSFTTSTGLAERLNQIPVCTDVLLAHQAWHDIQGVGMTDGKFSDIPHGLVMLTGDYHYCGSWRGAAANGEEVIAYSPGSTAMQALNEPVNKYFGVLYDDLSVEWVLLKTRQVITGNCNTEEELEQHIDYTRRRVLIQPADHPDIATPILHVKYSDTLTDAYTRLTAAAGDAYHLFLSPRHSNSLEVVDTTASTTEAFASLKSAVLELAKPNTRECVVACSLLDSPSPKETLEALFHAHDNIKEVPQGG